MRNLTKKFWTKRKIIIALIMSAVIAIGSFFIISCGGPKFNSKPDLEAIHGLASTSKPVPLDGTTPLDHDAKDNIYFAFNAMSKLSGFRTETSGTTTSMGIKQAIKAQRYVKGNEVFKQNVSHSSMAKVGTRTYVKGRNYVYQKAKAVESVNDVTWTVKAHGITEEKFLARYGFVANSITGYVMTDDTIISARQIGEPENGIYTFEYKLHTTDATGKVGLEMRTMANMESMPIFTSATLTVKMTSDWLVTQVKTSCKYKVNIKPLGAIDCVESITENFFDHGAVTQIPNAEFYQSFFGDGIDTPEEPVELTALDYVMTGFGEYIAGAKPLKASLTVTDENNAVSAKANAHIDLDIANLSTLSIKLDINQLSYDKISAKDIFLAYKDQTVYLKSGDFKGFGTLDQMGGLMAELLPLFNINTDGITSSFGSIDANALLAGANLIKTDGKAIVNIPISLSGIIADVNMIFNDGDTITIDKLTVKFGSITLNATPSDLITVSDIGDDYNNVATLFDVMDDNYNVKGEFSIGNLGGLVNFNAQTTDIDVIVDNTKIKLKNGVAYVNHNDLKVKLALDEIPSALESLSPIIGGVALPNLNESLESINALDLVSSILSSLKTTLTENTLTVYTTVKGIDFALVLGVSENGYTLNGVQTTIDGTDVNISFLSDVVETIKETELSEYNNILSLLDVIENNEINLNVNTFGLNLDVSVNLVDFTVLAKTEIYGKPLVAKFDGSKVYFSYLGLNAYVDINEIDQVLAKLTPIVGEVEIETPVTPSIEDVINNIVITENSISIKLFGLDVSVALNTTNNELTIKDIVVTSEDFSATATPSAKADYSALDGKTFYNILSVLDIIEDNEINLNVQAFDLDLDISVNLVDFTVLVKTEIYGKPLVAKFDGSKVYFSYLGLNAYVDINEIDTVLTKLTPIVGEVEIKTPTTPRVEDVINNIVITENSISLKLFGLNVSILLNTTNNELTIKDIVVTSEDFSATATPSAKADYSALDGKTFYNILSILDIIEENEINLNVQAFDLDLDVSVNLVDFTILAKTEIYGKPLVAKFDGSKVYFSYLGLNAYVDINEIDTVLTKLTPIVGEVEIETPTTPSVEDVINNIVITENSISLKLFGLNVSILLNTTNNELTIKDIVVTSEDFSATATPSAKADYSALDGKTFYNILSVLDIIEDNGLIALDVEVAGVAMQVTFDAYQMKAYVGFDGIEAYIDLESKQIYARYPGVQAKLNIDEIESILNTLDPIINKFAPSGIPAINLDGVTDIDASNLISNITVKEIASKVVVNISLDGANVSITLNTKDERLTIEKITVTTDSVSINGAPTNSPNVYEFDTTASYIDLKALAETFTPSLETILTAESLTASMTASMIMDGALYEIKECKVNLKDIYGKTKVVADLKLVISAINADGTTTVKSEHVIHLVYQDPSLVADGEPNVYFTYDDTANIDVLKGTFTTTKAGETMEIVKQLYTAIPELQDALYPFLIPNDKGEPTMPSLGIDFKTLINGLIFNNGVLSADINGLALNKGLGSSIDLELIPTNDNLALNIPQASFNGIVLGVNATVGAPENGTFDDGIFTYTIDENTMDFSSINELLLTLKNTASYRSFQINAKVDVNAIGIINIEDKINIDIQIDVVNGKTYVKAKLTRAHYDLLGIQAWKDWEGSSTLYYNPENDMILVEHEYYKIKGSIIKRKGDFASHTESYSVKDFTADPLTKILSLIRFSSMIENTILDSTQKEKTSYATIDNSLKGYKYDTTNNKFSLTINLEPLMGDIKIVNVDIGHDANMILNSLSMQANVLGALNLKLNATLSSIGQYLGVDTEVKNQVANF